MPTAETMRAAYSAQIGRERRRTTEIEMLPPAYAEILRLAKIVGALTRLVHADEGKT